MKTRQLLNLGEDKNKVKRPSERNQSITGQSWKEKVGKQHRRSSIAQSNRGSDHRQREEKSIRSGRGLGLAIKAAA